MCFSGPIRWSISALSLTAETVMRGTYIVWNRRSTPVFRGRGDRIMLKASMIQQQSRQPKPWAKKRRSQRVVLSVPVLVYRPPRAGSPFFEGTHTLVVSAHGAVIGLTANVAPDQRLLMQHSLSGEKQECRIVFTDKQSAGPTQVAVEFQQPAPNFWHIAFPPTDWALAR